MRVLSIVGLPELVIVAFAVLVQADAASLTVEAAAQAEATPKPAVKPTRDRPYCSYPAPAGAAGFRLYYQKRGYPGCHYGTDEHILETATAIATRIHR